MSNNVNHPSHYERYDMETIEAIKGQSTPDEYRGFLKGNVMKYLARYRGKNGIEDLNKAEWYLHRLQEFEAVLSVSGAGVEVPLPSNETKRDVFEDTIFQASKFLYTLHDDDYAEGILDRLRARYANALPDDLPTLPRIIGEYLKDSKLAHNGISFLFQVGNHAMSDYRIAFENWAFTGKSFEEYEKGDTFARAWILGVWHVEETGEIVKLEAEK